MTGRRRAKRDGNRTASEAALFGAPVHALVGPHDGSAAAAPSSRLEFCYRFELGANRTLSDLEVVGGLQIEPILRRLAKRPTEEQGQLRADQARTLHNVRDAHRRYTNSTGELGLRDTSIFQNFLEKFSR